MPSYFEKSFGAFALAAHIAAATFVWPSAANTGYSGVLTAYTGPTTITDNDVVIENKHVTSNLVIQGTGFVLRNCLLEFNNYWGLDASAAGVPITVEDCTIIGGGTGTSDVAILASGTFKRNDISHTVHGIHLLDGDSVIQGNYIHDLQATATDHYDCIFMSGLQTSVDISDNTFYARDTSSVFCQPSDGNINGVVVHHNKMLNDPTNGAPAYHVYMEVSGSYGCTNCEISDNLVQFPQFDYFTIDAGNTVIQQNDVDADNGFYIDATHPATSANFRSKSYQNYSSGSTISLDVPTGVQNGDVLVFAVAAESGSGISTFTPPAGLTEISTSPYALDDGGYGTGTFRVYTKVAQDEAGSYVFNHDSGYSGGTCMAFTGLSGDVDASTLNTGTGTSSSSAALTATNTGDAYIWCGVNLDNGGATATVPRLLTEIYSEIVYTAWVGRDAAGDVPVLTQSNNAGATDTKWGVFMLALKGA